MFILDVLIYFIFALILSFFAKNSTQTYGYYKKIDIYLYFFIVFFAIIAGIRWNVGSDCISYTNMFYNGKYTSNPREFIWKWLVETPHKLGFHWVFTSILCAFFQIYFIVASLRKYKYILIMLPFVLFGGRYWFDLMGAVRQMIVACMFLWASKYIYNRDFIKYLLFVVVSYFIHNSSLILLLLYFLPNIKISNKRFLLLIIFLLCVFIGQSPSFKWAANYVENIVNSIGYDIYADRVSSLLGQEVSSEKLSFGPMMITYLFISLYIIWYGPLLQKKYSNENSLFNLWFNMSYIYGCLYFLVCNISHIFIRPIMYFSLFQMVIASFLLYELYVRKGKSRKWQIVFFIYVIVISFNTIWDIYKANNIDFENTTYKVFFLHKEEMKLFDII